MKMKMNVNMNVDSHMSVYMQHAAMGGVPSGVPRGHQPGVALPRNLAWHPRMAPSHGTLARTPRMAPSHGPLAWQQYLAKPGARPYCSAQPQCVPLPPFEQWAPPELAQHAPKLPEAFWKKHAPKPHCVIRAAHAPIAEGDW